MNNPRVIGRSALFAIFTLSGFSGLIYESIWSHYFKLFLGHAAYAQTLVLTVFMGGMALGAFLAARAMPRLSNLLLGYAVVELITGAIALGFHPLYTGIVGFTFDSVIPSLDSAFAVNATKWAIAALLILPQSILLGATFPFISGGVVRRYPDKPGETLAMLYFTNSLGAALGVLASGFFLIGKIGLPGTVMLAGVVNVALGLVVWLLRGTEPAPLATAPAPPERASVTAQLTRRILLVAFLSGAAAFIYEIAWIRMLSLVLGASTHAFELMLSAFILGLAFGGLWIRKRVDHFPNPLATLAIMFGVMAILATLTLPAYGFTFDVVSLALNSFGPTEAGYTAFNLVSHGIAAAVMIPTTFIAGMTLPVMTGALLRQADERAIGRVYASNTVGAIVGVLIAVHLLLPNVGLKGAILAGAIFQLVIVFILQPRALSLPGWASAKGVLAAGVALVMLTAFFLQLDPLRMASGVYRKGLARLPEGTQILSFQDGKTATISLARAGDTVTIATNGKPDAAINMGAGNAPNPDEITMTLAAALPLVMHPAPRDVANIGIGSGLTSHTVLASPRVQRLDSIEIEPAMVAAARAGFGARVSRLFSDPRSQIHYEDAKTFFSAGKRQYDVIISEPSNPWVSGVATLFSQEFYSQIKRHLKADGLLVQWIQIYETDLSVVASIIKALSPHFADFAVYNTDDANMLIVASVAGPVPALDARLFAEAPLQADLNAAGLLSVGDIEIRRIGGKRLFDAFTANYPVPANSDFFPFVDLNAPRMRFMSRDALDLVRLGHLSLPVAELLGQPMTQAASTSVVSAQYFTRHRFAIEAQAILAAVAAGEPAAAPEAARLSVAALAATTDACRDDKARAQWLASVHAMASHTTPFVPAPQRAPLWQAVAASGCRAALTESERAWVDQLAAIASGDQAQVARLGVQILGAPPAQLSGNQMLETLLATVFAQIAIGQREAAADLLYGVMPMLQNAGQYSLALKIAQASLFPAPR